MSRHRDRQKDRHRDRHARAQPPQPLLHPVYPIYPAPRDRAVFAHIGQVGLASAEQIQQVFWPAARLRTCQERLALLVRAEYLTCSPTLARHRYETIYWLTPRALRLFPATAREHLVHTASPAAEVAHLLRTRDVLDWLATSHTICSFVGEHTLKAERARLPLAAQTPQVADGRVTLREHTTGREKTYLIEVDGAYYGQRLRHKVAALGSCGEWVMWAVFSPRRLATITRAAAAFPSIRPLQLPGI